MKYQFVKGEVVKIRSYNYIDYHAIIEIKDPDGKIIPLKGFFPMVSKGMVADFKGEYEFDKLYGEYFKFYSYSKLEGDQIKIAKSILEMIPNIGKQTIKALADYFGQDLYTVLRRNPEKLKDVPNIGNKKSKIIENYFFIIDSSIEIFDSIGGVTDPMTISNILLKFADKKDNTIIEKIKSNPYYLCFLDYSINPKEIDIALKHTDFDLIPEVEEYQIGAYILQEIKFLASTYIPYDEKLISRISRKIKQEQETVHARIENLVKIDEFIKFEEDGVQYIKPKFLDDLERSISDSVITLKENSFVVDNYEQVLRSIPSYKELNNEQKQSVTNAAKYNISVITGNPGTGKTKTISTINKMFKEMGFKTLLLAPTAKAAERMKELDKDTDAMTIHLALTMYATLESFEVVIIDEMSMVDFVLLNELLSAIDLNSTKVIMIGDPNQLPPVGFGEPFIEIIQSNVIPIVSFKKIYRQELQTINELAQSVLEGNVKDFMNIISNSKKGLSFVNINKDNYDEVATNLYFTIGKNLGNLQKLLDSVLILSPVKNRTSACTRNINNMIALNLCKNRKKINFNDLEFVAGDKVINRVNDYERRIMNGQIGYVGRKNKQGDLYIKFKEFMEFKEWELKHIQFAYSITIHSAQGQESDYIILPLHKQHLFMWTRRMLYTAITRAKKGIFFIGPSLRSGEGMKVIHSLLQSDFDKPKYMHLRKYIRGEKQ